MKTCSRCHQEKSESEFGFDKRAKDGLNISCRVCRNKARRAWYAEHPYPVAKAHAQYVRRRYGISVEEHEKNLQLARGKSIITCGVCRQKKHETQFDVITTKAGYQRLDYRCKECREIQAKKRQAKSESTTKVCSLCHQEKPKTEFSTEGFRKNGKQRIDCRCRACSNARNRAYRAKRKEERAKL